MITIPTIVLDDAQLMGEYIRDMAAEMKISVAYCAMDITGAVILSWKLGGLKPASIDIAEAKAITALRNRIATRQFLLPLDRGGKGWSELDVLNAKAGHPQFIAWAGGIPIMHPDGAVAGAIAVSGGTEDQDHELVIGAAAALAA